MVFKADLSLSEDFIVTFVLSICHSGLFLHYPCGDCSCGSHLLAISKQVYSVNAFCHAGVEFQAQSNLIDLSATRNAGLFAPAVSLSDSKQRSLLRWRGMFHAKLHYKKRKKECFTAGWVCLQWRQSGTKWDNRFLRHSDHVQGGKEWLNRTCGYLKEEKKTTTHCVCLVSEWLCGTLR